jgi:cytochrome c5
MKKVIIVILASSAVVLSGAWYQALSSGKGGEMDAQKLFESKCGLCHTLEKSTSEKKTKAGWEAIVMRMKNANGAPVSDREAKAIIEYLSEKYGK